MVFGTPGYIAPEAATGKSRDFRSDLFALGVVLYQCASGVHPFDQDEPREMIVATINTTPPPLADLIEENALLSQLSGIVEGLMAKTPEDRPGAADVVAHFEQLVYQHRLHWKFDASGISNVAASVHSSATLIPTIALERPFQ